MCGIAGIVDLAGRRVEPDRLARALATLQHRGPDDSGTWIDSQPALCVGLAATRLAVIDRTTAGHQPMVRGQGRFALVFNGLIYNYRELRDELLSAGEVLTSHSDTEVALVACSRWGHDALRRFNGMWALAFYDRRAQRGFLARDRFGIKPLVWAHHKDRLFFASEMHALTQLGEWPRDVRHTALVHYLRFGFVTHPETIYTHAQRLPPATYLPFGPSSIGNPS